MGGSGPLRIGMDAREAFRHNPRGIGLYCRHLMREFGELCHEDELLLYHEREMPPDMPPIPANMVPVRTEIRGARLHTWERVLMPWRLRRDRLSVYHGTYNTLPPEWPLWKGPPMVVSLHDVIVTWWPDDLEDSFVRYARAVTQRVIRQASAILTVSEWSRREILERFDAEPAQVRVFHNGVHPDFLRGAPEGAAAGARQRFAEGRQYLFSVGAPLKRKNTAAMITALGRLAADRGLEHLVLISGIDDRQRPPFREAAERAGIGDQVRFLPYVSREDLIGLYAGADLTIYPSLIEGWGIPVVESLALGTPVATSDSSGMSEAAGGHATLFDPTNLDSMAAAIGQALDDSHGFARTRDAAIARARGFTWRRAAEVTRNTYAEVAR
ncbi:MAG: glycosyltransferase family 4 protein [Planctomycetota bacterium]